MKLNAWAVWTTGAGIVANLVNGSPVPMAFSLKNQDLLSTSTNVGNTSLSWVPVYEVAQGNWTEFLDTPPYHNWLSERSYNNPAAKLLWPADSNNQNLTTSQSKSAIGTHNELEKRDTTIFPSETIIADPLSTVIIDPSETRYFYSTATVIVDPSETRFFVPGTTVILDPSQTLVNGVTVTTLPTGLPTIPTSTVPPSTTTPTSTATTPTSTATSSSISTTSISTTVPPTSTTTTLNPTGTPTPPSTPSPTPPSAAQIEAINLGFDKLMAQFFGVAASTIIPALAAYAASSIDTQSNRGRNSRDAIVLGGKIAGDVMQYMALGREAGLMPALIFLAARSSIFGKTLPTVLGSLGYTNTANLITQIVTANKNTGRSLPLNIAAAYLTKASLTLLMTYIASVGAAALRSPESFRNFCRIAMGEAEPELLNRMGRFGRMASDLDNRLVDYVHRIGRYADWSGLVIPAPTRPIEEDEPNRDLNDATRLSVPRGGIQITTSASEARAAGLDVRASATSGVRYLGGDRDSAIPPTVYEEDGLVDVPLSPPIIQSTFAPMSSVRQFNNDDAQYFTFDAPLDAPPASDNFQAPPPVPTIQSLQDLDAHPTIPSPIHVYEDDASIQDQPEHMVGGIPIREGAVLPPSDTTDIRYSAIQQPPFTPIQMTVSQEVIATSHRPSSMALTPTTPTMPEAPRDTAYRMSRFVPLEREGRASQELGDRGSTLQVPQDDFNLHRTPGIAEGLPFATPSLYIEGRDGSSGPRIPSLMVNAPIMVAETDQTNDMDSQYASPPPLSTLPFTSGLSPHLSVFETPQIDAPIAANARELRTMSVASGQSAPFPPPGLVPPPHLVAPTDTDHDESQTQPERHVRFRSETSMFEAIIADEERRGSNPWDIPRNARFHAYLSTHPTWRDQRPDNVAAPVTLQNMFETPSIGAPAPSLTMPRGHYRYLTGESDALEVDAVEETSQSLAPELETEQPHPTANNNWQAFTNYLSSWVEWAGYGSQPQEAPASSSSATVLAPPEDPFANRSAADILQTMDWDTIQAEYLDFEMAQHEMAKSRGKSKKSAEDIPTRDEFIKRRRDHDDEPDADDQPIPRMPYSTLTFKRGAPRPSATGSSSLSNQQGGGGGQDTDRSMIDRGTPQLTLDAPTTIGTRRSDTAPASFGTVTQLVDITSNPVSPPTDFMPEQPITTIGSSKGTEETSQRHKGRSMTDIESDVQTKAKSSGGFISGFRKRFWGGSEKDKPPVATSSATTSSPIVADPNNKINDAIFDQVQGALSILELALEHFSMIYDAIDDPRKTLAGIPADRPLNVRDQLAALELLAKKGKLKEGEADTDVFRKVSTGINELEQGWKIVSLMGGIFPGQTLDSKVEQQKTILDSLTMQAQSFHNGNKVLDYSLREWGSIGQHGATDKIRAKENFEQNFDAERAKGEFRAAEDALKVLVVTIKENIAEIITLQGGRKETQEIVVPEQDINAINSRFTELNIGKTFENCEIIDAKSNNNYKGDLLIFSSAEEKPNTIYLYRNVGGVDQIIHLRPEVHNHTPEEMQARFATYNSYRNNNPGKSIPIGISTYGVTQSESVKKRLQL